MSERNKLVSPEVVARRFAEATGQQAILPDAYPGGNPVMEFGSRDPGGGKLEVMLRSATPLQPMVGAHIGHFDPATDEWLFPYEYVRRRNGELWPILRLTK